MRKCSLAIFLATIQCAASAQSVCEPITKAVEFGVKQISYFSMAGVLDDSAARESNRLLSKVYFSNSIQANLALLQANKCPMPKAPVTDSEYTSNALECVLASSKANRTSDKSEIPECDRDKWIRGKK